MQCIRSWWITTKFTEAKVCDRSTCIARKKTVKNWNSTVRKCYTKRGGNDSQNEQCPSVIQHICSVSRVDGLPQSSQKRKYVMVQRVSQERRPQKIGITRSENVTLRNVQMDLWSRSCSKWCLEKLGASVVLMKRFKAWGLEKYEERASWNLENLTDVYNVKKINLRPNFVGNTFAMVAIRSRLDMQGSG